MGYSIKRFSLKALDRWDENRRVNDFIAGSTPGQLAALSEGRDPKSVKGLQHYTSWEGIKSKFTPTARNWKNQKELYKKAKSLGYMDEDHTSYMGSYKRARYQ